MNLNHLPPNEMAPNLIDVVIEVPMGSSNRYRYDPDLELFRLSSVLHGPMHYPGNYGFVPSTLAVDGEPVDVLVLTGQPAFPGTLLTARPLGYLEMSDEDGEDQKLLAVPAYDPRYEGNRDIDTISPHRLREIEHFFDIYRELAGGMTRVDGWRGLDEAHGLIRRGMAAFEKRTDMTP